MKVKNIALILHTCACVHPGRPVIRFYFLYSIFLDFRMMFLSRIAQRCRYSVCRENGLLIDFKFGSTAVLTRCVVGERFVDSMF